MEEIWKDVVGYEGLYQVSNLGKVRRLITKSGKKLEEPHLLTPDKQKGYLSVSLSKNGKSKRLLVHRLVAEAFIPNPNNYPQVNHIDENRSNESVWNLEWCDQKYNMNCGTVKERLAKINSKQVAQIDLNTGSIIATYCSAKEASNHVQVGCNAISKVARGYKGCKTAGGFGWKYI